MIFLNHAASHAKPRRDRPPAFFLLLASWLFLAAILKGSASEGFAAEDRATVGLPVAGGIPAAAPVGLAT